MDVPARAGRDRAVSTASAGPGAGKGAVPPWSSHGSGQPVSPTGAEAVYRQLFDSFDRDRDDKVSQRAVLSRLLGCGLLPNDPRISEALAGLAGADGGSRQLSFGQFKALVRHDSSLIRRAVEGNLAVPDFAVLTADIERMYGELLPVRSGSVADYIPQLKRVDPDQLAIAVCTVDGQRFAAGDAGTAFCLQSVSKTVAYCLALDEHGAEAVHEHVGREPSGRSFNELALNPKGLPHNPMVNAGAIMTSSLIRPDLGIADRFDLVAATWARLAGGGRVGFNNAVYLSERQTADRNFALGYSMRESGAFGPGTDLTQTLEFYFQGCSIEVDAQMLAVAAASLANAGVCPLTEDPVFTPGTVQSCLSLMSSCGMYDFSGEFAFTIGLPAKSGVSGAIMLVIPGLMGIAVWSPRLDELGNSVRGIEFCRQLAAAYNVHVFDSLATGRGRSAKRDPRRKKNQSRTEAVVALTWAASQGDLDEVRALTAAGVDPGTADYDGRTPLHLAAAEGQPEVVSYLLALGTDPQPQDRWGGTPLSDAEANGHTQIAALLRQHGEDMAFPPHRADKREAAAV
jgi:glutaminase